MEERGVNVDHATLNRWVIRYAPTIAAKAQSQKRNQSSSIDDDDTKSKIKNYYSSNADRDIELVFSKMSSLLGLMDETYNYSIFKGRQLNEIIKKLKN